jgi:uncharacterized membrane protein
VLALSYWFRRRAMFDEQRRDEVMEDERDRAILASADRAFRITASICMVVIAAALAIPRMHALLDVDSLRLPGLLLLCLIAANIAAHASVLRGYVRERM